MRLSAVRMLSVAAVAVALVAVTLPGASAAEVRAGVITTVAGGPGGPGPGRAVAVDNPCGVTFSQGKAYFTEAGANLVRRLDPGTGLLSTVAGTGTTGLDAVSVGERKPALDAPCGTAVDAAGNVIFDDTGNNVVRVVAARTGTFYGMKMDAGHDYIVAGGGYRTGTPARRVLLTAPTGVTVDAHGNLLVSSGTVDADTPFFPTPESAIVVVVGGAAGTFYGQRMVPGGIHVLAGDPCGAPIGGIGCPPGYTGDGGPAVSATFGTVIQQLTRDSAGDVLVTDTGNNVVRLIAAASRKLYGQAMTAGDIYTIAGGGTGGLGDKGPARQATLSSPRGVAVAANGNVVVSDTGDQRVRLLAARGGTFYGQAMTGGDIYTIAGNGTAGFAGDKGPAVSAELRSPSGAVFDRAGDVMFADAGNRRVRLVAARTRLLFGQPMTAGHIYTVAGNGRLFYYGDGVLATRAQLDPLSPLASGGSAGVDPGGLAVSPVGRNIIIADAANYVVRVVAETTGVFYGRKLTAGHIYTVAGGPGARLKNPTSVAADAAGNILVSDIGLSGVGLVRVIAVKTGRFYGKAMKAGHLYTVAKVERPSGLAVDHDGNILLTGFDLLRVLAVKSGRFYGQQMTAGHVYTIVGDDEVWAVAVDHAGNVVTADFLDSTVTVLAVRTGTFYGRAMTAGQSYTVAGDPGPFPANGYTGDRGPAIKARLNSPGAVAVDPAGNLLVADSANSAVRVIAERTGTFYGVKMIAGDIYTVAGGHQLYLEGSAGGFSGDGGPAVKAVLYDPCGIAPFGTGLVVLDDRNYRVRAVSG